MLRYQVVKFWQDFDKIRPSLQKALSEENREEIADLIQGLNEDAERIAGCKVEIDIDDEFYEMTFDTGANKTSQYIADLMKNCVPDHILDHWIINSYRHPLSKRAMHTSLAWQDKTYTAVDFKAYYTIDENAKNIYLKLYCPAFKGMDKVRQKEISSYMLELFIGELELEARIAHVEILEEPSDDENVVLLANLYEDICDIIVDLNWHEYHDPTHIYNVYKLNEAIKGSGVRKDMVVVATSNPLLFEEIQNREFDSCRILNEMGGEYGYLYYEHKNDGENVALLNAQLEKEIQALLYPLHIARTIGSAVGSIYNYIDLILFDREAFLEALNKINEKLDIQLYYRPFYSGA